MGFTYFTSYVSPSLKKDKKLREIFFGKPNRRARHQKARLEAFNKHPRHFFTS